MPVCALPNADGFLAVVPDIEAASCSGYVMVTAQEYDTLMSYTQLTPGEISQAFGLGFTLVFLNLRHQDGNTFNKTTLRNLL